MSLADSLILPRIYDGLATPPVSPGAAVKRPSRLINTHILPPDTPVSTAPNSPTAPAALDVLPPSVFIPLNDAPRSLQPGQLPIAPPNIRYPSQLHIDTTAESLTREKKGKMPALSHLLSVGNGRVLALAADERYVYAGCQSAENEIVVFSRSSLQPLFRLLGHQGSILALMVVPEKGWLISSSGAGDIRIWCTTNLEPVYIIHPCDDTAGDIYSLAWDDRQGGTLYFGTQSTSVEWVNFATDGPTRKRKSSQAAPASVTVAVDTSTSSPTRAKPTSPPLPRQRSGRYRPHKFFDNPPSSGASTPRTPPCKGKGISPTDLANIDLSKSGRAQQAEELEVPVQNRCAFAHYGYVYALTMVHRQGEKWLVSGSGDSDVKLWQLRPGGGLRLIRAFAGLTGAVLSLVVRDSLLYAGLQDGEILVWDLETAACIRTIEAHEADVMTMSVLGGDVFTAAADGRVLRVNEEFDCTAAFRAHKGIVLSSVVVQSANGWDLITAGNDGFVKIWSVELSRGSKLGEITVEGEGDVMLYALSKLIAVPTVSDESHRESCRQGAHLLRKLLTQLGANAELIHSEQGRNPLVIATFSGTSSDDAPRKRLLFYGHYDVQPAAEEQWETNPWELSGRNGYLYGRGVSDNKGPILAIACAASALRAKRDLDVDVVMVIEGEEEAGSRGFATAVRKNKDKIGHIDTILLSNSTWINEEDPCVVYGMRGVVYANLTVSSKSIDAHSGVDGGMIAEPMFDMVRVLGAMSDGRGVALPGFYDDVRPKSADEMSLLSEVAKACGRPVEELVKVWREPSFSIANITSGAAGNKTVIPRRVTADISMRIVPDQDMASIVEGLKGFCEKTFASLESSNTFEITVTHSASWWLASLDNPYFQALESAVHDVWGVAPLKIREGGTVPTISWLEQEFGAPCVHLPLGQASDAGHLANERMRLLNLRNGKRVVELYLGKLGQMRREGKC